MVHVMNKDLVKYSTAVPPDEDTLALRRIAHRLMWWQTSEFPTPQTHRLIAQVMVLGSWDDVQTVRRIFGMEAFREVLRKAPAGVFDARSWVYWHYALGVLPVPSLTQRRL
jgi:hypothetical protein